MEILILKPTEAQDLKDMRIEAIQNDSLAFGESFEEVKERTIEKIEERLKNDNSQVLLARENEKPVGMVGVNFEKGEKISHIAYIWGMYVNPSYRGQGIGKKLLAALLAEILKNKKIKKINLNVNTQQVQAVKLYESFGFQIAGTLHQELKIGEEYFDEYLMEKIL